jgi:hypothetical protein
MVLYIVSLDIYIFSTLMHTSWLYYTARFTLLLNKLPRALLLWIRYATEKHFSYLTDWIVSISNLVYDADIMLQSLALLNLFQPPHWAMYFDKLHWRVYLHSYLSYGLFIRSTLTYLSCQLAIVWRQFKQTIDCSYKILGTYLCNIQDVISEPSFVHFL